MTAAGNTELETALDDLDKISSEMDQAYDDLPS